MHSFLLDINLGEYNSGASRKREDLLTEFQFLDPTMPIVLISFIFDFCYCVFSFFVLLFGSNQLELFTSVERVLTDTICFTIFS